MRTLFFVLICLACLLSPPGLVWLAYSVWGTPHVVYRYTFHDNGRRYDPLAKRRYISCTYWGPVGTRTVSAQNGHCPWIRFFRSADGNRRAF